MFNLQTISVGESREIFSLWAVSTTISQWNNKKPRRSEFLAFIAVGILPNKIDHVMTI
jgi:hypothetical protein